MFLFFFLQKKSFWLQELRCSVVIPVNEKLIHSKILPTSLDNYVYERGSSKKNIFENYNVKFGNQRHSGGSVDGYVKVQEFTIGR